MRTDAPLLAPIFRSDGQARLLSVVLLAGEYTLTELAKYSNLAYPTAHREVGRLLEAGILVEHRVGRARVVSANEASPLVPPLREILLISTGPVVLLAEEFALIEKIEFAFLYGSFAARVSGTAGPSPHDIDVMVIGTPDTETVYDACARIEELVHRSVNPTILTRTEAEGDSGFLVSVFANPTIPVFGVNPWH
jgi:DNA-binding transcriptional ArsR family regulator